MVLALAALLFPAPARADGPALPGPDPQIAGLLASVSAERIQRSIYVLASFPTRNTLSDPLPSGDGVGAAAAWIQAELGRISAATGGRLEVDLDAFTQPRRPPLLPQPVDLTDIIATLPGSGPAGIDRTYVLCAHYDSRASDLLDVESAAPGADDDASGVAAALEAARALSGRTFPATLVFAFFSGEEQGLFGSAQWAREQKRQGRALAGVLNDDLIGHTRGPGGKPDRASVRLFVSGRADDTPARELARAIRDIGRIYLPAPRVRLILRADRYRQRGDQMSFLENGYPAVRLTEPVEDLRLPDAPDRIDFSYVADVARLNVAALAALALAPAPPQGVEIEAAGRENDTTLRWQPSQEANLAGYRLVWRETTAPFWEHAIDLPRDATSHTVPGVSRDDVIFGVEAFDAAGHFSPATEAW